MNVIISLKYKECPVQINGLRVAQTKQGAC